MNDPTSVTSTRVGSGSRRVCVFGGELDTWLNVAQTTAYAWVEEAAPSEPAEPTAAAAAAAAAAVGEGKPGLACVNLRSDANETTAKTIKNPLGGSDEVEVAVVAGHNLLADLLEWSG